MDNIIDLRIYDDLFYAIDDNHRLVFIKERLSPCRLRPDKWGLLYYLYSNSL